MRSSTSANTIPSAWSGYGGGCSVITLDLPPTDSATKPCGPASSGRRSGGGLHGHGRRSSLFPLFGYSAAVNFLLARLLPLTLLGGLIAYRYLVGTGRLRHQLRFGALLLTRAQEARRLLAERREIVDEA
jgi:hypothetical protein